MMEYKHRWLFHTQAIHNISVMPNNGDHVYDMPGLHVVHALMNRHDIMTKFCNQLECSPGETFLKGCLFSELVFPSFFQTLLARWRYLINNKSIVHECLHKVLSAQVLIFIFQSLLIHSRMKASWCLQMSLGLCIFLWCPQFVTIVVFSIWQ